VKRREFLMAAVVAVQGGAATQEPQTNFAPMSENGHRPVRLPPKSSIVARISDDERDAAEHQLKCMCGGCILDVYTCRTTDFTCPVSPPMHRDVLSLVDGGYSADEILDAFANVYGERVLTAPRPRGFNWAGYVVPFVAIAAAASVVTVLLRRWTRTAAVAAASSAASVMTTDADGADHGAARADGRQSAPLADASADEMARLYAAVRNDEDDEP
jgi:cytochrome c-type biogenesis protein CcmH